MLRVLSTLLPGLLPEPARGAAPGVALGCPWSWPGSPLVSGERSCRGTNATGDPCGAPSRFVGDDGWCPPHRPGNREALREAGRKGTAAHHGNGARDSPEPEGLDPEALPPLRDHADAKKRLDLIGRAVLTGRIGDKVAHAATRAVREWIRGHEGELTARVVDDLEQEVERLQREVEGSGRPRLTQVD